MLKRSAALKTYRETWMIKHKFSKLRSFNSKAYYCPVKQMFAILSFSFLSKNVAVFNTCKQAIIKLKH